MNLLMLNVFVLGWMIRTYGQEYQDEVNKPQDEVSPPLPTPNFEIVNDFRVALDTIFGIEVYLHTFLENDDNKNVLFSPLIAAAAIAQLILGAEGKLQKQFAEILTLNKSRRYEDKIISYHNEKTNITYVLPYSTLQLHLQLSALLNTLQAKRDPTKHFHLSKYSVFFLKNETVLKDSFRSSIRSLYGTKVLPMDFVPNVIRKFIPQNTPSFFVSGISFKSQWKIPFDPNVTRCGIFESANKTVNVKYMINQLEQIPYAESSEYRIIGLPYTKEELGMYIILPKPSNQYKYDMKGFLQSVKYRELLDTISKASRRNVVVKLPHMKFSASFSIIDILKKHRSFDQLDKPDAYFLTNAAVGESLQVEDIIQFVKIFINEGGSAGATTVASYMGQAENVNINRPFIFFIRHEATSATLFWGAVTDPTAEYWWSKA